MPNTSNLNLPYPEASDTVDVPRDIQALADALDTRAIAVSASTSAPASPAEGMLWYQTNTDKVMSYNGTAWVKVAPKITVSTSDPSGGDDGDIWVKVS